MGITQADTHDMLAVRARELAHLLPTDWPSDLVIAMEAPVLLGIAEVWLADACREVPGFADWLDKRRGGSDDQMRDL